MNPLLRIATILLLARAGWASEAGLTFLAFAAIFWSRRDVLTVLIAGGLGVLGVAALAIAIPSFVFAFLLRTGKRWASWVVVVGDSEMALVLFGATV